MLLYDRYSLTPYLTCRHSEARKIKFANLSHFFNLEFDHETFACHLQNALMNKAALAIINAEYFMLQLHVNAYRNVGLRPTAYHQSSNKRKRDRNGNRDKGRESDSQQFRMYS